MGVLYAGVPVGEDEVMVATKIDWLAAKKEYIQNTTLSLRMIAEKYGVAESVVKERSTNERWVALREEHILRVDEKLSEIMPEEIARYKARKYRQGQRIADKAEKVLMDDSTRIGGHVATEMLNIGHKIQTEALGLDKPQTQVTLQGQFTIVELGETILARARREYGDTTPEPEQPGEAGLLPTGDLHAGNPVVPEDHHQEGDTGS